MSATQRSARDIRKAIEVVIFLASAAVMTIAALEAAAEPPGRDPHGQPAAAAKMEREVIPGADLMSSTEREAYRRRMEAAATPEDRARVRGDHMKIIEQRRSGLKVTGDPVRGASLHKVCFSCHGIERYTAPVTRASATFFDSVLRASGLSDTPPSEPTRFKGRIKSISGLRDFVIARNDFLNPKMSPQDIEDVVAYLNATYYKFPVQ